MANSSARGTVCISPSSGKEAAHSKSNFSASLVLGTIVTMPHPHLLISGMDEKAPPDASVPYVPDGHSDGVMPRGSYIEICVTGVGCGMAKFRRREAGRIPRNQRAGLVIVSSCTLLTYCCVFWISSCSSCARCSQVQY